MKEYINKIICGDCLDILKDFPDGCVDLVLTDPPYGINIMHKDGTVGGTSASVKKWAGQINHSYPQFDDTKRIDPDELLRVGQNQIIWGGEYITDRLPVNRGWLIWYKRPSNIRNCYGDCEFAWTSFDRPNRCFHYMWMGMLRDGEVQEHYHATQKPLDLGLWIIGEYSQLHNLILDPYCGSGTFCVAAKMLGRRYIGIDISPDYCQIAEERLRAFDTGVSVKEARAGQRALFE